MRVSLQLTSQLEKNSRGMISVSHISMGLIYFIIVAEFIQGFLAEKHIFDRFSTIYYFTLFILMAASFSLKKWERSHLYMMTGVFLLIIFSIFVRIVSNDLSASALLLDIQFSIRSTLLMFLAIYVFSSLNHKENQQYLKAWAIFQWGFVTLAIIVHMTIGLGADKITDDYRLTGYFSYFRSGNQMMPIYIVSLLCVTLLLRVSFIVKVAIATVTLYVVFATGSRSGIAVIAALSIFLICDYILMRYRALGIFVYLALFVTGIYVLFNIEAMLYAIIDIFVNYSGEGEKISSRLDNVDITTIVFSGRNVLIMNLLDDFRSFNIGEWLFGKSIYEFSYIVGSGSTFREFTLVENDFFDILGAYGLTGVLVHYGVVIYILIMLFKMRFSSNMDSITEKAITGGIVALLLFSVLSGHIFTAPFGSVVLGMFAGMAISFSRESMGQA